MTMTSMLKRVAAGVLMVGMLVAAAQPAAAQSARTTRVQAFSTDTLTVWVSAGWHQVIVDGDGDTDLDLFVYNSFGRLLDFDDDGTDYCVTSFFMARAGYVTLRVQNLGSVYNQYRIEVR
jgi:hypothetical protein